MHVFAIGLGLALSFFAHAGEESAYRHPDRDFSSYESRFMNSSRIREVSTGGRSAHRRAKLFPEATLPQATIWTANMLQARFEKLRDEKFIETASGLRRPSWLYPDDGCFARAAMANRVAFQEFMPVPSKVFAFGNLRVKTTNHPRGSVSWWYHVAPIVQVGETKYVLDPAIEFSRPLTLEEWLGRMGSPEKMKVSVCSSGTYSPGDNCDKETNGLELRALRTQKHYLSLEEQRARRLGLSL